MSIMHKSLGDIAYEIACEMQQAPATGSACLQCTLEGLGYDKGTPERYVIFRCKVCGHVFHSDIPRDEWLMPNNKVSDAGSLAHE